MQSIEETKPTSRKEVRKEIDKSKNTCEDPWRRSIAPINHSILQNLKFQNPKVKLNDKKSQPMESRNQTLE